MNRRSLPWLFAGLAIAAQICWPLTSGALRTNTTLIIVLLFAAASVSHAAITRGITWASRYTATALLFGLLVEFIGTRTGWPFSDYAYTDALRPQLLGVPVIVPLAWTMMAYPALLVGRRLTTRRLGQIVLGAYALAAWDLFLDPQMVGENYWRWTSGMPALPGIPGIPWVNYLGWFAVSLVLMTILSLLSNHAGDSAHDGVPVLLYTWTWIGGIVANAFFLGRPAVAMWGGAAMGIVAVPYLIRVRRDSRPDMPA